MSALGLVEFLTARLREERVIVAESQRDPWRVGHKGLCDWMGDMPGYCSCDATARALADVEAKRLIVQECAAKIESGVGPDGEVHTSGGHLGQDILEHLASTYTDHPDYQKEWKP